MDIVRIEKKNLVDEVYRQMRTMIVSGSWREGEKLIGENQLAKQFDVSRVVIREALQRLRSENLVITRQGLGSFVSNPSNYEGPAFHIDLTQELYADMLDFRRGVEFRAIQLAAERATDEDFDNLQRCLDAFACHEDDVVGFSIADYEFHLAVVKCSHNILLEKAYECNRDLIVSIFVEMNSVPKSQDFGVEMHTELTRAIRARQTKEVLRMYEQHAEYNTARLADFFKQKE